MSESLVQIAESVKKPSGSSSEEDFSPRTRRRRKSFKRRNSRESFSSQSSVTSNACQSSQEEPSLTRRDNVKNRGKGRPRGSFKQRQCVSEGTDRMLGKKFQPRRPQSEEFHCDRSSWKRRRLLPLLTDTERNVVINDNYTDLDLAEKVPVDVGLKSSSFKPPYKSPGNSMPVSDLPSNNPATPGFTAPAARKSSEWKPAKPSINPALSKSGVLFGRRGVTTRKSARKFEDTDVCRQDDQVQSDYKIDKSSTTAGKEEINNCKKVEEEASDDDRDRFKDVVKEKSGREDGVIDKRDVSDVKGDVDVQGGSSCDMNDEEENLLLCLETEMLSSQSQELKRETPASRESLGNTSKTPAVADIMFSAAELEEARMKQEKLGRSKLRRKVQPKKGQWLETRSRVKKTQTFQSAGVQPMWGVTRAQLLRMGVSESTLAVNSSTAGGYRFDLRRHFPSLGVSVLLGDGAMLVPDARGTAGWKEFHSGLLSLESVDPRLLEPAWTENHYRWIVWKLASTEVCFPQLSARCLSPDTVMYQLKYRYDREVDLCHRSALRKMLERDEASARRMVLCVSRITRDPVVSMELTDGWYSLPAQIDAHLSDLLTRNKIKVGDKIVTSGAELVGEACSPLEVPEGTALKLSGNSTRPAPWHARLGLCRCPAALCVPLSSLSARGDTAGAVDVVMSRRYPTMYMEKLADGSSVFRSSEEEAREVRRFEERRQDEAERLMARLQGEVTSSQGEAGALAGGRRRRRRMGRQELASLWSGEEIHQAVESALNPEDLQQSLTDSQLSRLEEYRRSEMDRRQQEMRRRVQEAMAEKQEMTVRSVTPVQKFRVVGSCARDVDSAARLILTVWRPGPEWTEVKEGQAYRLFGLSVSSGRGSQGINVTAGRNSGLQPRDISDNLVELIHEPRDAWMVRDLLRATPVGREFDFVGVVLRYEPAARPGLPALLYLCDTERGLLCVRLWSPPSHTDWQACLVVHNLTLATRQTLTPAGIVSAEARSEFTTFTSGTQGAGQYCQTLKQAVQMRKSDHFLSDMRRLLERRLAGSNGRSSLVERSTTNSCDRDFPPEMMEKIFSPMSQLENASTPKRVSKTGAEITTPSASFGDETPSTSGVKRKHCVNVRMNNSGDSLSGVDVRGDGERVDTSEQSEQLKKRKRLLREKMSKLLAYDRPAPLATLPSGGSPAASSEFKSPLPNK